jgi:transposase
MSPVYTSQRCSKCGWTCKSNRKGKKFVCIKCESVFDADYNASLNISFDLPEISKAEQLKHNNRKGFYWNVLGKEPIVPSVQKA